VSELTPITLEAEIQILEETDDLMREAAAIVDFPKNKTPDVLFFSGCFVSSGENLNHAYFMPSEMAAARHTIDNKALDIEHEEENIVGHIYSSVFVDRDGNKLNTEELSDLDPKIIDKMDIDVMIAGIVYKSRFPLLAEEIVKGKWKLSMETYYQNYDIKIGNLIMSRKEAEAMGLDTSSVLGKMARIFKRGKELAAGSVARVLRDLLFSGCGLVKQPANPRSLIFETAKKKEEGDEIIIELDSEDSMEKKLKKHAKLMEDELKKYTISAESEDEDEDTTNSGTDDEDKETSDINSYDQRQQTSIGICVSYKKYVYANEPVGPDTEIVHDNWCTLYDDACTSFGRDVTDPNCLRRQAAQIAERIVKTRMADASEKDERGKLLKALKDLL